MKQACIVVPIYKTFKQLSKEELRSLNQLFFIFCKIDIFFICGKSFESFDYIQECKKANTVPVITKFHDRYFSSIEGYNKLMLSPKFYRKFEAYNFMLVYQLDAFVFRNDLDEWCNRNYDFIGAPWFEGWDVPNYSRTIIGVGNGGFSLRNIKSSVVGLKKMNTTRKIWKWYQTSNLKSQIDLFKIFTAIKFFFPVRYHAQTFAFLFDDKNRFNEDVIFGQYLSYFHLGYKVAPIEEAMLFSFENNPSYLYELTNQRLPFGCHAWEKYDPIFWEKFINTQ